MNAPTYKQGDLVVCLTAQYHQIPHNTIGVITSVPKYSADLVNCMFNGVRGSFPTHQIMHLDVWQYHEDKEKACR